MPVECTPDDLASPIACLVKQDSQTLLAQILYQLCVLNDMACDPDTLADADEVKCLQNWDTQALLAAMVYMLCQINGGGGVGSQEVYINRDPAPPDNPLLPALNYPDASVVSGVLTQWDVDTQTWF